MFSVIMHFFDWGRFSFDLLWILCLKLMVSAKRQNFTSFYISNEAHYFIEKKDIFVFKWQKHNVCSRSHIKNLVRFYFLISIKWVYLRKNISIDNKNKIVNSFVAKVPFVSQSTYFATHLDSSRISWEFKIQRHRLLWENIGKVNFP